MFLTLDKFLQHFPPIKISRSKFIKKLIITYSPEVTLEQILSAKPLKLQHRGKIVTRQLIKDKEKDVRYQNKDALVDYLYQMAITHRHFYLAKHYNAYFCFINPFKMKWNSKVDLNLPDSMASVGVRDKGWAGNISLQKNDSSRRMVRNLFYLELLHLTEPTNSVNSKTTYWQALDNFYNKLKLDDRLMSPSSIKLFIRPKGTKKLEKNIPKPPKSFKGFNPNLNYHNLFYQLQAYQAKASIINPYFIHWILENLFQSGSSTSAKGNGRIFTPVLSWASYLIAFMHTPGWDHYVGVDVMPTVCEKVDFLAKYYHNLPEMKKTLEESPKKVELFCTPSELLAKDSKFIKKHKDYFDLVMICPPYFDMELYHEGQQSTDLYPDYNEWLKKYWQTTCEMCYKCTRKGGQFALIINDYNTLKGKYYPLAKDMSEIVVKAGFKFDKYYYLFNRTSPLRVNKKERTERLVIFTK
tara:strand:- start:2852 stop:4255 length:1404 start_codon:yes stop_codon:yes gene_type:complete